MYAIVYGIRYAYAFVPKFWSTGSIFCTRISIRLTSERGAIRLMPEIDKEMNQKIYLCR